MNPHNLHNQYHTLCWRGMPEHPRLRNIRGTSRWPNPWGIGRYIFTDDEEGEVRDLITAHALRWWLNMPRTDNGENWGQSASFHAQLVSRIKGNFDILSALIETTVHLEPANDSI